MSDYNFYMADHNVACQAKMMISTIENVRDWYIEEKRSNTDFRIAMQNNTLLQELDGYLTDKQMTHDMCTCPVRYLMEIQEAYFAYGIVEARQLMVRYYNKNLITVKDFTMMAGRLDRMMTRGM